MPVVLVGIPLLIILTAFVAYALAALSRSFSGGFVGWLENTLLTAGTLFSIPLAAALRLTSWLTNKLGLHFAEVFGFAVQFLAGIGQWLRTTIDLALSWPGELFRLQQWLIWHKIPQLIQAAIRGVAHEAHAAVSILKPVVKIVYRVPKISRAAALAAVTAVLPIGLRQTFSLLAWLRTHLKALAHLLAHPGLSVPFPNVDWDWLTHGKIGRVTHDIKARLKRLEELTAAAAGVGLLAKAMQRMGINWIRCNNVKRIGKGLCSSPAWLINLLAAGVVEAFIIGDLCQFTTLLEAEAEKFKPVLLELVNVEDSLINCGDNSAPGRLRLPPLSLPPMPAPSSFAA